MTTPKLTSVLAMIGSRLDDQQAPYVVIGALELERIRQYSDPLRNV